MITAMHAIFPHADTTTIVTRRIYTTYFVSTCLECFFKNSINFDEQSLSRIMQFSQLSSNCPPSFLMETAIQELSVFLIALYILKRVSKCLQTVVYKYSSARKWCSWLTITLTANLLHELAINFNIFTKILQNHIYISIIHASFINQTVLSTKCSHNAV